MDMYPGREEGTWLGMVQDGRIGCLLNVPRSVGDSVSAKNRGHLVVNYLKSKLEGLEYVKSIEKSGMKYQDFNLVTLDPTGDSYKMVYYNHHDKIIKQLESGIHGFGNCSFDKPFLKVKKGLMRMEQIIETSGRMEKEEELTEALEKMMRDEELCFPDPQLSRNKQLYSEGLLQAVSSIYVCSPKNNYGTR